MNPVELKRMAGREAIKYIENDMVIGVGTGSTVEQFIIELSKVKENFKNIITVPSSYKTETLLKNYGFEILDLERKVDVYIDGADAIDRNLNLVKGGGGALTREKILAYNSRKRIIIADESKIVENIFQRRVPVEILIYGYSVTMQNLKEISLSAELRKSGEYPFITDNGNYIVDLQISENEKPENMNERIKSIPGVVEHGIFIGFANLVIIAKNDGSVELFE